MTETTRFYLVVGVVVLALAAASNLAFGFGFGIEPWDHHRGHFRH